MTLRQGKTTSLFTHYNLLNVESSRLWCDQMLTIHTHTSVKPFDSHLHTQYYINHDKVVFILYSHYTKFYTEPPDTFIIEQQFTDPYQHSKRITEAFLPNVSNLFSDWIYIPMEILL